MRRCFIVVLAGLFLILGPGIKFSHAGEIDLLLRKLVEKGVLSGAEAQQVKVETQEEMKKELVKGESAALPEWIQTMKMNGDFRLRYQSNHSKPTASSTSERHRGRFRLRLGAESKVNDKLKVAFGLASGTSTASSVTSDTIRSTNQSFDDSFAKKPINLDYAFAAYTPVPWATLIGGKMKLKDVIWASGDLIWDGDITPEGASVVLSKKFSPGMSGVLNTNFFVLEEDSSSGDDPWVFHLQPILSSRLTEKAALKTALSYYYFSVKEAALHGSSGTNTTPLEDFQNVVPAFELSVKRPFEYLGIGFLDIPKLTFFGEYAHNLNNLPKKDKSGYMLGLNFGAEKIAGWGDWQVKYNFARLGKDAVLDILPDSDRYSGKTGVRSHEITYEYGLGKNTWLSLDIYRSQLLAAAKSPETIVQLDWNMKF